MGVSTAGTQLRQVGLPARTSIAGASRPDGRQTALPCLHAGAPSNRRVDWLARVGCVRKSKSRAKYCFRQSLSGVGACAHGPTAYFAVDWTS